MINLSKQTALTVDLETPITGEKNLLYCATFQLAWNYLLTQVVNEPLKIDGFQSGSSDAPPTAEEEELYPWWKPRSLAFAVEPEEPPQSRNLVTVLNQQGKQQYHLNPQTWLAMAGFGRKNIHQHIAEGMRAKFNRKPQLGLSNDPMAMVAYAYFEKNLPFDVPFENFATPLIFADGQAVQSFGMKERGDAMRQVGVISYDGADEFIIKLQADEWVSMDVEFGVEVDYPRISETDEIILAKIAPRSTLKATINAVQVAIQKQWSYPNNLPRIELDEHESLQIPKVRIETRHEFNELIGKQWLNPAWKGYSFSQAVQEIQFNLDERGAAISDEAVIEASLGMVDKPRQFLFDKPFLLMLKDIEADTPYFVAWIQNSELLVRT